MCVQVNKNVLVKGRVGTDAAVASLAFKAWWQPSFTFAASAGYDLRSRKPRVGFVFNVENYGNIRCAQLLFASSASCTCRSSRNPVLAISEQPRS